jgi:hypothetical protein
MGIETLNTAAHAAGFAMATSEEVAQVNKAEPKAEAEGWRSEASLLDPERDTGAKAEPSTADWLRGLFGFFGRGAPA